MSFFDEDDDVRTRQQPRPRRAAPPPTPGASTDDQTLLIRRAIALGGGVVLLILMVVAVRGCLDTRRDNALKDYNRSVGSIAAESEQQVGKAFFDLISRPGGESPTDLQSAISGYREQAETQLSQAERLDVPGDMVQAQQALLIALELRRDGLDVIANRISAALAEGGGDNVEDAVAEIAGQMQAFLASDVLFDTRVIPFIKNALDGAEIGGQQIIDSNFLPDAGWLSVATVADRLGQDAAVGRRRGGQPAPGTHGHGLLGVRVGENLTLQAGGANRIPVRPSPVFIVSFENQGENDEFEVKVTLTVDLQSGKDIRVSRTVDTVTKGSRAEATVALPRVPSAGTSATIRVRVEPVPGERKADNNEGEYPALFTPGA